MRGDQELSLQAHGVGPNALAWSCDVLCPELRTIVTQMLVTQMLVTQMIVTQVLETRSNDGPLHNDHFETSLTSQYAY